MAPVEQPETEQPSATYDGSCHCGAIAFKATLSPPIEQQKLTQCNCSICYRNGYHLVFTPDENVEWTKGGEDAMTKYSFNKQRIVHHFCPTCGTSLLARSVDPNFFPGFVGVNARSFDGVDVNTLEKRIIDGKAL
ncbi:hypothetical protein NA57DRAFT_60953 [Rhizodiscina lignyota]|uniref:CENP-V/GFA domain-containing protein n=1 Tax=Rhizodiscina lignyota TaxID=1504668 RepID=A0A9P4I6F1_9PEZI|nr:hypothetical protein NA57DRAFT_60953 [Rhizodiscina lignyota]